MITEGGTSDEYYFNTLPTSTPTDLHCETTYNDLTLTWSDPTTGMTENATYQFTYSLTESMFNIININIKCRIALQFKPLLVTITFHYWQKIQTELFLLGTLP